MKVHIAFTLYYTTNHLGASQVHSERTLVFHVQKKEGKETQIHELTLLRRTT